MEAFEGVKEKLRLVHNFFMGSNRRRAQEFLIRFFLRRWRRRHWFSPENDGGRETEDPLFLGFDSKDLERQNKGVLELERL